MLHLNVSVSHILSVLQDVPIEILHVTFFQTKTFVLGYQRFVEAKSDK